MKRLATGVTLSLLVMLPAHAGQHRKINSPAPICDNSGRCTVITAPSLQTTALTSKIRSARAGARRRILDANGNAVDVIISGKTGARARVALKYAARFQAYIDDLENNHGARVLFMNGIRRGRCSASSEHPCGKALDVCQLRRGVIDARCHLPDRITLGEIAAAHGLFEGGRWCNSDYGHAQIGVTAAACHHHRGTRVVRQ